MEGEESGTKGEEEKFLERGDGDAKASNIILLGRLDRGGVAGNGEENDLSADCGVIGED